MATVTVLICTYNRHLLLRQCLTSLIKDSQEKPDEVVIVNGGDQQADRVAEEFIGNHSVQIKLIKIVNKNLANSRNVGLEHCTKDIIAFTDDDVRLTGDWIKKIKELHQNHPQAGVIGGKVDSVTKRFLDKVADEIVFPSKEDRGYVRTIPGANVSYKGEVIDKTGEFDERMFRGEDVDYNFRVIKAGYNILYEPQRLVYHYHRATWKGLVRQIFMYGRAYYLVRRKWKEMYCVYPHGLKRIKDFLKLGYFFVAIVYEPIRHFIKKRNLEALAMIPVLIVFQIIWKTGMIIERIFYSRAKTQ